MISMLFNSGYVIRVFEKFSLKEKFNYDFIYPTTHDGVIKILKSRKPQIGRSSPVCKKTISFRLDDDDQIYTESQVNQSTTNSNKYEKFQCENDGLQPSVYLSKKNDYDIFNEIVHDI